MFNPICPCFSPCAYDSSEMKSLPVVIRERDVEYQVCDCSMLRNITSTFQAQSHSCSGQHRKKPSAHARNIL